MNINNRSWEAFTEEYAKTYLHDADKHLPRKIADFVFSKFENPRVLDIGCGNARFYEILAEKGKDFNYHGLEVSTALFDVAKKQHKEMSNFVVEKIDFGFDGSTIVADSFDIAVIIHVCEISSSLERLLSIASKAARHTAVVWFEYPRFDFTELEIKEFVNHENASKRISTPYIRAKYSKQYLAYLESRFNLENVLSDSFSEKDVVKIYRRKDV
jgi:SAM-dependent methyltransferase